MVHFVIVGVLVIASTLGLGLLLTNAPILPLMASEQAVTVDWLFNIHWWLIAFFFSLITVFILYSVFVFRRKPGERGDGKFVADNHRLEAVWTIIPIGIVLSLAVIGASTLADVERRDPSALSVDVYASQWVWRFEYTVEVPTEAGESVLTAVASDRLILPLGQQVVLRMRSTDVIHSFWVPEFRVKQDILPGGSEFVRELRITPTEAGTYQVMCAELCGQLHYAMVAEVQVVSAAEFDAWLAENAGDCNLTDEQCGQRWAATYGCTACHSLTGQSGVGPTWLGLYNHEVTLTDGSVVIADLDYLHRSIVDPNAQVVAGFQPGVMPQDFAERLTEEQIQQIIAFIVSLQQ
ncbi:MAG: cytochrome c oxidase subunit II [Anaerolineales bacterium]|nr:cytochrome c oxidase subunit II [Anaerolineales bacterium]